ncbi:MAG: 2-dehydropantoate 2-reductase [Nitrospirae bacterium CG_4_9_14_3_um_filter_53_35]|nr:MAG: 2-dehydropantoate 2-reductase [Nitrospirae bacterium CG_4_10_14_3_um_filter_53_41]PJA74475.1 MAG: 2-dehydropantoate 2-reductase [Nitrospirae bacterium CG_4_9_14_3_um_filter_53_35]
MKILVMGAGSIGSVFGGFLAEGGHEVTLVGRPWHMEAIQAKGLHISGIWGDHTVTNLRTLSSLPDEGGLDLVLLTVKSYQTRESVSELDRHILDPVPILSLQNGLGNLETIAEIVGPDRTLGGRVIFGAEIRNPGEVAVTVYADRVVVGPMRGSRFPARKTEEIAAAVDGAGIPCMATREIERYIWGKVLYNAALNAPASILEINYGKLLENESTKALMREIIVEAFAVANADHITLDWPSPEAYLEILFDRLIPPTASHFPSMLQDIRHGKKTEIDAINGAIARLGQKHAIPTPVNETLSRLVRFKESGRRNFFRESKKQNQ